MSTTSAAAAATDAVVLESLGWGVVVPVVVVVRVDMTTGGRLFDVIRCGMW